MQKTLKPDIKNLTKEQLIQWLQDHKIDSYRASQILKWIYHKQADDFEDMTDLNKSMRALLSDHFTINRLERLDTQTSRDGTQKYLFKLVDGCLIESVLIPERDHYTLCISSQVGCAQNCRFCLTAKQGFARNLTPGEIIAQVRDVAKEVEGPKPMSNIVLMGMGEPLANYRNVIHAIHIITDNDEGLRVSNRKVTLSTAGLIPKLLDLGKDTKINLAVSLNATDNETRNRLMPINRKYPIEDLIAACKDYPLPPTRRITFEYILIKDVNDSEKDAERLSRLLRPLKAKVNLIPFNEFEGGGYSRSDDRTVDRFQEILLKHHYTVVIRQSKGRDISAACGQLSGSYNG
jgi:23S rRNA (adenine2503-C2)-methyltransferase